MNKFFSIHLCIIELIYGLFSSCLRYVQSFSELIEFQDEQEIDEVSNR